MAGKGFNFLRMAEEAMRVIEEVADAASAMSDEAETPRSKGDETRKRDGGGGAFKPQSSRASSGKRKKNSETDGLGGAAGLAGLAALGIAAFTHHQVHKMTPQGAPRAKQHSEEERARLRMLKFEKDLIANFEREANEASRDRSSDFASRNKALTAKERRIKAREAYLVVDPKDEPLVDPVEAEKFFSPMRASIKANREKAVARMRRQMEALVKLWRESNPQDTAFERKLEARLQARIKRDDRSSDRFLQRITDLEAILERIRAAVARGEAEATASTADTRYLSIPAALELTAPRLEELSKRMLQPRDKALAALFDDLIERRIDAKELEKALDRFDWNGTAVADVLERAILNNCVRDRLGFQSAKKMGSIDRFGMMCVRAVVNLPPEEIDLSGEDAARIAVALIADFERKASYVFLNPTNWAILAPVTCQMSERLKDYLTRDEAQALFKRLEAAAMREMDEERRKRGHTRIFAPYAELLKALAEAAQVSRPVPALAKWDALLASRAATREDILSTASPFWRPLLSDILDATRADHRKMGALEKKGYGLIKGAGDFDEAQQEVLAKEVGALLNRSGEIRLASRDDNWVTNAARLRDGDNIAYTALERLQSALALDPRDRRAYFAPPTDLSDLGEFAKLLDAQEPMHGGNAIIEGEIGDLLTSGQVEEAERQLRDWIEKAPDGSLRDAVLAIDLDDITLIGWDNFRELATLNDVGAVKADFSDHCVINVIEGGGDILPTESGGVEASVFDFAGTPIDEVRKIGRTYGTPWQASCQPCVSLEIDGLMPVLKVLFDLRQVTRHGLSKDQQRLDAAIDTLAETWCFAAFAVKVHQAMQAKPLPRVKPVILSTHDFGMRIPDVIL